MSCGLTCGLASRGGKSAEVAHTHREIARSYNYFEVYPNWINFNSWKKLKPGGEGERAGGRERESNKSKLDLLLRKSKALIGSGIK